MEQRTFFALYIAIEWVSTWSDWYFYFKMTFLHFVVFVSFIFVTVLLNKMLQSSPGGSSSGRSSRYECFQFPESSPVSSDGYRYFDSKTTYMTAREALRIKFNAVLPDRSKCTPLYLHYLSRHAIRYPMRKEVVRITPQVEHLRRHLLNSGKLSVQLHQELTSWRPMWLQSEAEHITQSGRYETALQARIFYRYFPTLMDLQNTDFEVGITDKIRTVETAQAFIRSLIEFQLRSDHSFEDTDSLVEEVMKTKFPTARYDRALYSYKRCKFPQPKQYNDLLNTPTYQALVSQFVRRYNLGSEWAHYTTLWHIYMVCRYEMAIFSHSSWCALFTLNELKAIEYSEDLKEYHRCLGPVKEVFCTVTEDLVRRIERVIEQGTTGRTRATLYFSHNELFRLLSPFMRVWDHLPNYRQDGQRVCVPRMRDYHASYLLPFGANFVAVLHQCGTQYRLLTLLNEIPVKIAGCSSEFCDVKEFLRYYRKYPCDLDKICPAE